MKFRLKSTGDIYTVNKQQICYQHKRTINNVEYDVLHMSDGTLLIGFIEK